jgi:hypothetical protein
VRAAVALRQADPDLFDRVIDELRRRDEAEDGLDDELGARWLEDAVRDRPAGLGAKSQPSVGPSRLTDLVKSYRHLLEESDGRLLAVERVFDQVAHPRGSGAAPPGPATTPASGERGRRDQREVVFFLSYVRYRGVKAASNYEAVRRLFVDLSMSVSQMVDLRAGQHAGFMDDAVESGGPWRGRRRRAVSSCHVFVSLLTPRYVDSSRWCAMEWDLFSRRRALHRDPPGGDDELPATAPIIPVMWEPLNGPLPTQVAAVADFGAVLSAPQRDKYRANGLQALRVIDPGAYRAIVTRLAREIARLYGLYQVEPLVLPDDRGLRRSFSAE